MKTPRLLLASLILGAALASCSGTTNSSSSPTASDDSSTPTSDDSSTPTSGDSSSGTTTLGTVTIAASQTPHAVILEEAVAPILEEKGYELKVTVLDWTFQNDAVYNGDYDANYFQHRSYLQIFDSGDDNHAFSEDYEYTKVFPVVGVHFEPLRIYPGKSTSADFESKKTTATYCIANDPSNADRAIQLLAENGIVEEGVTWEDIDSRYSNITKIEEELLAASLPDYDYGVLPANTALTGNISADLTLPSENSEVKALRANVLAANVSKYSGDSAYKARIDALADALLDSRVSDFIGTKFSNVVDPAQTDYRS